MRLRLTVDAPLFRELVQRARARPPPLAMRAGSHRVGGRLEFFLHGHAPRVQPGVATIIVSGAARPPVASRRACIVVRIECDGSSVHVAASADWLDQQRPFDELHVPGPGNALGVTLPLPGLWNDPGRDPRSSIDGAARRTRMPGCDGPVAIVGASRLGSQLAVGLLELGFRRLALIDDDVVDEHHLDAMELFGPEEVGNTKAAAVARWLAVLARERADGPHHVAAIEAPLEEPHALQAVLDAALIVTAPDRGEPRLLASLAAITHRRVHLDVGTGVFARPDGGWSAGADVRLVLPGEGCLLCIGGLDLDRRRHADFRRERAGSLRSLNAMAAALALQCVAQLRRGELRQSTWQRLVLDQAAVPRAEAPAFERRDDCPVCRRAGGGDESWTRLDAVASRGGE